MRRNLFLILALGALLGGCAGGGGGTTPSATRPGQVKQVSCDDGGSGGVMIDGVCL